MRKALRHLKQSDPVIAAIIDRAGKYGIEYREPVFATLVRSIVFQQLSGKAAATIFNRLQVAAGGIITADSILELRPKRMQAVGLSRQKIAYIRDLARKTRANRLAFEGLAGLSDEQVIETLTQVKGVGVWTAQMFLMFALRRNNVLPVADLGVRSAIQRAYRLRKLPSPGRIELLARPWHPYCSVACWYLWRSLEFKAGESSNMKSSCKASAGTLYSCRAAAAKPFAGARAGEKHRISGKTKN